MQLSTTLEERDKLDSAAQELYEMVRDYLESEEEQEPDDFAILQTLRDAQAVELMQLRFAPWGTPSAADSCQETEVARELAVLTLWRRLGEPMSSDPRYPQAE